MCKVGYIQKQPYSLSISQKCVLYRVHKCSDNVTLIYLQIRLSYEMMYWCGNVTFLCDKCAKKYWCRQILELTRQDPAATLPTLCPILTLW